jgi:putative transcriptional regulator
MPNLDYDEPPRCRAPELLIDVKALRKSLNLSQFQFAESFGFSLETLRQWERHRRHPNGAARVLLMIISYAPDTAREALKIAIG